MPPSDSPGRGENRRWPVGGLLNLGFFLEPIEGGAAFAALLVYQLGFFDEVERFHPLAEITLVVRFIEDCLVYLLQLREGE